MKCLIVDKDGREFKKPPVGFSVGPQEREVKKKWEDHDPASTHGSVIPTTRGWWEA